MFKEISTELEEFLLRENDNADSTDDVFEFLVEISNQAQEEFDKLFRKGTDKQRFLKLLTKIIALLLITKVNTAEKI